MTDTITPLPVACRSDAQATPDPRRGHARYREQGLSLVELMVAMLISTLIMIGLVQVFSASRSTYTVDEGLARLQENGRFAMDFLARDIRMAGNMGCIGNIPPSKLSQMTTNYLPGPSSAFDFSRGGIEGYEAVGTTPGVSYTLPTLYSATNVSNTSPTLDTTTLVPSGAVKGSDVLVLRTMDPNAVRLVSPFNSSAQVFVSQPNNLQKDQILVVTDCDRASIFQATTVSNSTTSAQTNISHANPNICSNWGQGTCPGKQYKQGAQIAVFNPMVYYVAAGANGPSLWRNTWPGGTYTPTELVEGVENMQILYGVDSDRDEPPTGVWHNADRYVPASQIPNDPVTGLPDWSRVVSVRVALLVSGRASSTATGQTNSLTDTATYSADGVTLSLPAADTRQRRVFTATVELRNRH